MKGLKENWRLYNKSYGKIQRELGLPPVLAKILVNRMNEAEIPKFLDKEGTLTDPLCMKDMDRAVAMILDHVQEGHRIEVIGDYDVDGMSASAILGRVLQRLGASVRVRIPDRVEDGYGIRPYMVEACAQEDVSLILTCDNGIREFAAARRAKELGIALIITDHHEIERLDGQDHLPEADCVVNPHRADDEYPFPMLCGAGVAYQLARALCQQAGISESPEWIGYAALGTVCDVMPLLGENRKLVYQGLRQWNQNPPQAIRALMKVGGLEKLDVYTFGFVIGPMINSGGRLEQQQKYIEILLEEDPIRAEKMATRLYELNRLRQKMTEEGIEAGLREVERAKQDRVFVIHLPDLHESLAGLVAGRIKEKYQQPVFVLTGRGDGVKGSGRSIPAYNMFAHMNQVSDCFTRYGGHPMAAGLSMKEEQIPRLRSLLNEQCGLTPEDFVPVVHIDMEMPLRYADENMADLLETLEPYGTGNPKPLFAKRGVKMRRILWMGKQKKAMRILVWDDGAEYECVSFRTQDLAQRMEEGYGKGIWHRLDQGEVLSEGVLVDICYQVGWNWYRGNKKLQRIITNIRCSFGNP